MQLFHFKNHRESSYEFTKKINFFCGKNGVGKTNILDAIYYTATFRSFIQYKDSKLTHEEDGYFRIVSDWLPEYKVVVKYAHQKKVVEVNDVIVKRPNRLFGHIPIVISSPQDLFILHGTSSERRKFIDYTKSLVDKDYLEDIIQYQKILDQRNSALKKDRVDKKLLDVYDESLIPLAQRIYKVRNDFMTQFTDYVNQWYLKITNKNEAITLTYQSQLSEKDMIDLLSSHREKDLILKRTTAGIHKDDIDIQKEGEEAKKMASQGQQKTLLYAIRLAQAEYIANAIKKEVVFLFDDISDKLDRDRIVNLINTIPNISFVSQWFITDTDPHILDTIEDKEVFNI